MKSLFMACSVVVLSTAMGSTGRSEEGVGERIGETVDKAVEELRGEARGVAKQIREGFDRIRARVDRMGVEARVYARLRWDKALSGSTVEVAVREGKVTVLRGTVGSDAAKTKAEQLAQDTVGVEQVVNELRVEAAPAR